MSILLQHLVKKGLLEKEKAIPLEYELKESGKKEEEFLLEKDLISEKDLFALKSEIQKLPLKEVVVEEVPLETLELIPEETAKYYQIIPLLKKGNILEVGMVYPEDLDAQEALNFLARQGKFTFEIFLITPSTFNNLLKQYRTLRREMGRVLEELEVELKAEKLAAQLITPAELERLAEEAPITKVVAVILRQGIEGGASDIHIEPTKEKVRVRFRFLGELHPSIFLPLRIHPAIMARIKILSNLKIDETRIPQDGRFSTKIEDKDIDFRVSTFPTSLGEKVAIRILDPTTGLKKFEKLGLRGRNFEVVEKAIKKPYGMILATGPTGCGKTTTLYAILQILNREGVNIVTLEDPIEYFVEGINQSQVRSDIGYDFATGLRHVLRQDPDIIMVGEIRDTETASLATHAALTGHIVLSTLHTNNVLGVIPRLIDMGIQPFLIPPTLGVALSQRLVRILCPDCKKKTKAKKEVREIILKELTELSSSPVLRSTQAIEKLKSAKSLEIWEPVGCKKCNQEGFVGRTGLYEVLEMTDPLAEIVLKEPSEMKIEAEGKKQGMITMKQDGILKALDGITSIEEVLRVAEEK